MRVLTACLLAGTALGWPLAATATGRDDVAAAPAAPAADPAPAEPEASAEGDIIVIGRGETRQVQRLGQDDIAILTPGTSPLKAIQKLPGVNFQSADPFGAYEWSQRVSIRGFNQNQLGFTLDGIPLGDGTYGNTNGLHISRAISSENIGETRVSQGSGSLGTQATNNLGGTIEFFSSDPKSEFGLSLDGSYGSNNTVHAFGRLDTGQLGDNGPSAYVSYSHLDTGKWKGRGAQRQNQVNAKAIAPITPDLRLVGTFNYSERREQDYQDMSLDMIRRLGYRWDNITGQFPLAVLVADVGANSGYTGAPKLNPAAGTVNPAPFLNADDAYYDAAGLRNDYVASLGIETSKDAKVHGQLKAYYHDNRGQGIWFTPYVPSPSGVPISVRTTEYNMHRKGVFGSLGTDLGAFGDITVGGWYERNDLRQARRFYGLDSRLVPTRNALEFQDGAFATQWDLRYKTDTVQYYVEDKIPIGDLTINLGWKGFDVRGSSDAILAGPLATGKVKTTDWFQPHAGFTYKLGERAELFGGFTQVTRAFVAAATSGPLATTQAGFNGLGNLKPESSDTYELGVRGRSGIFTGSLSAYYINFRDRLLAFSNGAGILGNPAILQNVGGVRSYGVEATGQVKLPGGFGAFASYAYNNSKYRDDVIAFPLIGGVPTRTVVAAIEGKNVVDAPTHIASGELTYDSNLFFSRLGANYMSKRYFTYTNDQSVPARVLFDATIGVRVKLAGDRQVELQLNGTNLLDKDYVATIGSNGFGNSGDGQTLLIGAPRQVFVTLKTGF
ncbi:TonB-dependent receptor [Sphingomonas sp. So64.6b]|uniref:TonB-dependent receptor domain-containing protein n=1 Tax=Sphingomonas sp. So64.6b TaxID=2997354 RepID=UPI001603FCF8|nr:TonB-dependent receptor [Sphingomonas sp. So64.6b]QNA85639.1 TonB-dependent receptor [Sphingomonas sp. So64.6b]